MKDPEYNLLDEPWIPIRLLDGTITNVGLLELVERTSDIADLACELPTQNIAIQRLILAIAYRVATPSNEQEWAWQWNEGAPTDRMLEYLEEWRDRFYLFGGRYPFMQVADLRTEKDAVSGLEKIIADVPNGEQFFTTRHGKALANISAAEAARWLIHAQAYDPSGIRSGAVGDSQVKGGKGYPIGPSWCGHLGIVWLKGENLDESLVLNLVPSDSGNLRGVSTSTQWGGCTWEDDEPETAERGDYSLLDSAGTPQPISIPRLLTWHSRRVRLAGDVSGVTGVVLAQGDKLAPQQMQQYEPLSLWCYSKGQSQKFKQDVYMPNEFESERALWRNLPGILPGEMEIEGADKRLKDKFFPSATLLFHYGFDMSGVKIAYPKRMRIQAVGVVYGPKKSTFEDIYFDELMMPVALMPAENHECDKNSTQMDKRNEKLKELYNTVNEQVRTTENVARVLGTLAANLARAAGESGDRAGDSARDRAKQHFYARVDDPFRHWLVNIDGESEPSGIAQIWKRSLRAFAQEAAAELVASTPSSAIIGRYILRKTDRDIRRDPNRVFMNVGIAENYFNSELNKLLPIQENTQEGMK